MCEKSFQHAIEARQHHYNNFNYWMNFYAIVIGALFVGYYNTTDNCLLNVVIVILGFATTFAWLQSFRGYYHWIKHWIEVVKFHEDNYIKSLRNDCEPNSSGVSEMDQLRVYNLYYESNDENSRCPLKTRNISTQKMTLRLIFVLLVAWGVMLLDTFIKHIGIILSPCLSSDCCFICMDPCCCCCISVLFFFIIMVVLFTIIIITFTRRTESNTSEHYILKKKKDSDSVNYEVLPPRNGNH